jgi:ATP-dependent protease ClpP protease subunit
MMKRLSLALFVLTATLLSPLMETAKAETLIVNPKRTLNIYGPVDSGTIFTANRLLEMTKESKDPVYIVLNSPGGGVLSGMQVISIMRVLKSRGVEIHCVVPMMAASMAFQFFAECTHRYAFEYSLLLWHPIRAEVNGVLTPKQAIALAEDMQRYEKYMVNVLLRELDIDEELFYKHYYNETFHLGGGLKDMSPDFLTIITDVVGVKQPFSMR